ncbi:hypothetical protein BDR03DRAFT_58238 [Suillus americanus]|nr:hypothetical protein BDR03DRAFT_58238 [Suillus americanus]
MLNQHHPIAVTFCHRPSIKRRRIHLSSEAFLPSVLDILYAKAWRLRSLRAWNISDSALLTILSRLVDAFAPSLTEVSIKGNSTLRLKQAFYWTNSRREVPFLIIIVLVGNRLLQHTNEHYAFGLVLQLVLAEVLDTATRRLVISLETGGRGGAAPAKWRGPVAPFAIGQCTGTPRVLWSSCCLWR